LPAAFPSVLTGMRISLGIGLIVAVVAEMIAGNSGIGYFIIDRQRVFRIPEMFAGIFTLGILGYSINFVFLHIERHFLRWRGTALASKHRIIGPGRGLVPLSTTPSRRWHDAATPWSAGPGH